MEKNVLDRIKNGHEAWTSLLDFQKAVEAAQEIIDFELPSHRGEEYWLKAVDASIFHESFSMNHSGLA